VNEAQLVTTIKAHIAKGDKAAEKSEQHYIAAGQHLKTLKATHGGSWAEWEALLKDKIRISTGRASELIQIADGRKTVAQIRANKAESVRQLRARSSLRSEEDDGEEERVKACIERITVAFQGAQEARVTIGRHLIVLKAHAAGDWDRALSELGISADEAREYMHLELAGSDCTHEDAFAAGIGAYSSFDKDGNPTWTWLCCGGETRRECGCHPSIMVRKDGTAP
jgi:hypothetical protein